MCSSYVTAPDGGCIEGGGGHGGEVNGQAGFADGIVNSALRFRAQAPIVDQLLKEIGLEGGDIQRLVSGVSGANAGMSDTPTIKE